MKLTDEQINNLYSIAIEEVQKVRFDPDFMNILSSIWNVYERPSTGEDSRYTVLGDEIMKHYVMNDDWPDDKLFISILNIKEDDSLLLRFIQELINFQNDNINENVIDEINRYLSDNISIKRGDDGYFVFFDRENRLSSYINKTIRFVKCWAEYAYRDVHIIEDTVPRDIENNVFLLAYNGNWNDYGYHTWFVLYYIDENGTRIKIGNVKIMNSEETNDIYDVIDDSFYNLPEDFCSLGQDPLYYTHMFELFKGDSYRFLLSLRDSAVYSHIHEKFENYRVFVNSLCRGNLSEKALREGRFIINGRNMEEAYAFGFLYKPEYFKNRDDIAPISISFEYKYKCKPYERVYGLIGENGVGKTTLLNDIIESLTDELKKNHFEGLRPIFSKVIAISYSPFDTFPTKKENSIIDYLYCGLLENDKAILSKENQNKRLRDNIEKINERGFNDFLCEIWLEIMKEVFSDNVIQSFYSDEPFRIKLNSNCICNECEKMSSGETIFIYSISDIIANIRKDALLLFDEPEQHLHPHGIMQLIRAIYTILEKFESYAIIATHSPLVIREMLSKNVYVFNREEDCLHIAKIGIESFGEDIAILNDIIFKNRSEDKQYEKYIEALVEEYGDYNKVVSALQNEHNELGLNTRLLIQNAIERKKGENA